MAIGGSQGRCVPLPPGSGSAGALHGDLQHRLHGRAGDADLPVTLEASVEPEQRHLWLLSAFARARAGDPECSGRTATAICDAAVHGRRCPADRLCDPGSAVDGLQSDDLRIDLESAAPRRSPGATPDTRRRASTRRSRPRATKASALRLAGRQHLPAGGGDLHRQRSASPASIDGVRGHPAMLGLAAQLHLRAVHRGAGLRGARSTPGCTLVREDCLTDEPCRTWERVYDCPVPISRRAPTSSSATATSTASTARARRSSARPMTSSRMRPSRSTRWTRRAANSIPTRSPCSRARATPARPRSSASSTAARARASRSSRASSCSWRWAAAARRCCSTSAMRRACAPMSAPIARTASSASA